MLKKGTVYLIGAGPGDPGLITVKGAKYLAKADVVVYDRLVNPNLLTICQPEAEIIYVGKRSANHTVEQEQINQLLAEKAKQGKVVARLKGGDAFIFGRGGEEALYLAENGVTFEVIPGVSSAYAVPAYAGIPVTQRGLASDVAFITGHEYREKSLINWEKLAQGVGSLVFLMGVKKLPEIAANLIKYGKDPKTPTALISWGTTADQRCLTGTLADIADKAKAADFHPPAVIVVGEVVRLRNRLNWFESKPLFGKRVLVTRAKGQASELSELLLESGAEVIELPTIEIKPLSEEEYAVFDAAVKNLAKQPGYFSWTIFTSVNTVRFFQQRLNQLGFDWRILGATKIAAVGKATEAALKKQGVLVELLPSDFRAEGLIDEFKKVGISGKRVLIPRALKGREVLPEKLRQLNAEVVVAPVYKTVYPDKFLDIVKEQLLRGRIDIVTFTSGSTIKGLASLLGEQFHEILAKSLIAVIGPVTAKAAEKIGLKVDIMPSKATTRDLAAAIVKLAAEKVKAKHV